MRSWSLFLTCAIPGLLLFVCGWLIPAHLRAVDSIVIENAGAHTHSVVASGISLVNTRHAGAAEMMSRAAKTQDLPAESSLEAEIARSMRSTRHGVRWAVPEPLLESMFGLTAGATNDRAVPFTDFVLRRENQEKAMAFLDASSVPGTRELMHMPRVDEHGDFFAFAFVVGRGVRRGADGVRAVGWRRGTSRPA